MQHIGVSVKTKKEVHKSENHQKQSQTLEVEDFIDVCRHGYCWKILYKVVLLLLLLLLLLFLRQLLFVGGKNEMRGKNENCASVLLRVEHTEKGDAVSPVKTHTHTPWSTQRNQHRNFCTRTRKEKGRKESKTLRQPSAQLTARQSKKEEGQNGKGKERVRVTVEKRHLVQEKDSIVWHSEFSTVNQAKDIHQNVCFVLFCCFWLFNDGHFT